MKSVVKPTGIPLSAAATEPKETGVAFHVVAEGTVAAVAPVVEHVPADRGGVHGGIDNVLGEVEVRVGHQTRFGGGFFREFLVHGKEDLDARIELLLEVEVGVGTGSIVAAVVDAAFLDGAGHGRHHGRTGVGRTPGSGRHGYLFAFDAVLSRPGRSK